MALPATIPAEAVVDQLFAQNGVGVAVLDREGRYVRVNAALAAMNLASPAEHLGRTASEVLPPAGAELVAPLIERALAGEALVDLAIAAAGRSFVVSYLPVASGADVAGALGLVVETTESSRTEAALQLSRERLQLALEGTETGTFEWTIASNALVWSENMGVIWGRDRGWSPPSYEAYLQTLVPEDAEKLVADVSRAVTEGSDYQREFRVIWPDGQVRWMHSKVHVVPGDDGRPAVLVGLVSDITARRRRELDAEYLSRASLVLARSLDLADTLREVAELAVPDLGDWCAVHHVGPAGTVEQVAVAHERPDQQALVEELQRRYPPDPDSPIGVPAVIRTGRPELYPEISDELLQAGARDADHLRLMRALRLRSVMIVPMVARGRTVGAITFAFAGAGREYGTEELGLAEELGRRAGLAVDNARLLRAEQTAHRRLRALQSVTDVALNHLELGDLLRELLDRVRDITGSDLAEVLLTEEQEEVRVTVSGTIEAEPARTVRTPLVSGGEVLGALRLLFSSQGTVAPEDVELLELVADRVARAIAHARVYDQVRATAVTLQRSLLPGSLPRIPGHTLAVRYLPGQEGSEVGGDFYDAFPLSDGRFAVVVGDVVGRGVVAAADMGRLRAKLRAYAYDRADPAAALERLDSLAEAVGGVVTFATVALLALDPVTGAVDVALAGHLPPLVRGADGSCRRLDFPPGLPLGAPMVPRRQDAFTLAPGDTLLLYTDGLVERRGELLDARIDDLCGLLARAPGDAEALLDRVLGELVPGGRSDDDVALLAVRRLPRR